MLQLIRKSRITKAICLFMAIVLLQVSYNDVFALTGGPSQPEVNSFTPASTSDMVNVSTGDFTYNIPLLEVGGYPINLSYQSDITMDQEASWVGLGWNLNAGAITRNVRGLPDDFSADEVVKEYNIKPSNTFGFNIGMCYELCGFDLLDNLSWNAGIKYNTYRGFDISTNLGADLTLFQKGAMTGKLGLTGALSTDGGASLNPKLNFSYSMGSKDTSIIVGGGIGCGYSSRQGLTALTLSSSMSQNRKVSKTESHSASYISGSGGIDFASFSGTPEISMPVNNYSGSLDITLGGDVYCNHPAMTLNGYFSIQQLEKTTRKAPAYGYLYAHEKENTRNLNDFTRANDMAFSEDMKYLPVPNRTYDIYTVNGQGIGGTYRPFRNEFGDVYDIRNKTNSLGIDLAAPELGLGSVVHIGVNTAVNYATAKSGRWYNRFLVGVTTKGPDISLPEFEPYYFKQAGEISVEQSPEFLSSIRGKEAVKYSISDIGGISRVLTDAYGKNKYLLPGGEEDIIFRDKRQMRNQNIQILTAQIASVVGFQKQIEIYNRNIFSLGETDIDNDGTGDGLYAFEHQVIDRIDDSYRKPHHISEIQVTKNDGSRYIFGLPAYNKFQEDVSFAVSNNKPDCNNGLVRYTRSENSKGNESGKDHYYNKTRTPGHAHSFLLTCIVSPDYVDRTGNGPSDDDYGTYTKFNYCRASDSYKWRVPYQQFKANHNEGLKSIGPTGQESDDKASYIYGEKELWYLHSIETKTQVAQFITAKRSDGIGARDKNGGMPKKMDYNQQFYLQSIKLFSKADLIKEEINENYNATPVKTVHFVYGDDNQESYNLCKGLPNNIYTDNRNEQSGKLTLYKVYFTYKDKYRGRLSPYKFHYSDFNPDYNMKAYDRWGNFKPVNQIQECGNVNSPLSNAEYPYTDQKKLKQGDAYYGKHTYLADVYATAWRMNKIDLPSGGSINVDYESKDYAYVQNLEAMSMFKVVDFTESPPSSVSDNINNEIPILDKSLYEGGMENGSPKLYAIIRLLEPISNDKPVDELNNVFRKEYFPDQSIRNQALLKTDRNTLFFNCLTNVSKSSNNTWEYVSGFAPYDVDLSGLIVPSTGDITHAYIKLKDNSSEHPVSKKSWDFLKQNLPDRVYSGLDSEKPGPNEPLKDLGYTLVSFFAQLVPIFKGFENYMKNNSFGSEVILGKSWIRLKHPTGFKKGGGARVKRLRMSDTWAGGDVPFYYGQEYDYTTTQRLVTGDDAINKTISSGVAAWEPAIGGEENPFKYPIPYKVKKKGVDDDRYAQNAPVLESLFPSPQIIYSKVTVKSLQHENVTKSATGKTVHEFYTAKEFPVIQRATAMEKKRDRSNMLMNLLKINVRDNVTTSQGYVMHRNDMHGKQKSQRVYPEGKDTPISGVEYFYRTDSRNNLDNTVPVLSSDGTVTEREIGVEYDVVSDFRENKSNSKNFGLMFNTETFLAGIFPVVIPTVIPKFHRERTRYRSAVIAKTIQQYGIIDRVVTHDLGAETTVYNKVWDAKTGEVLVTETHNSFNDPLFAFTQPAYWVYEGAGQACQNIGVKIEGISLSGGAFNNQQYNNIFFPGDEVLVRNLLWKTSKGWIWSDPQSNDDNVYLMDEDGEFYPDDQTYTLKIIRSGRKNQLGLSVASITGGQNPVEDGSSLQFDKVLNAQAIELTNTSGLFCQVDGLDPGEKYNPYVEGEFGMWRPKKSYLYLTQRTQSVEEGSVNGRKDGYYTNFSPFWQYNQLSNAYEKNDKDWTWNAEVSLVLPYGQEVENVDPLGRYSSAIYGYNYTLPVSVSANAQQRETAFDGCEDYDFYQATNGHFDFRAEKEHVTEKQSHTGRRSIRVAPNSTVQMSRQMRKCE